jgi:hypothetical protein
MSVDGLLLESSVPTQGSYVAPDTKTLTLTFNKEVSPGEGSITLTEIGNEGVVLTPDISEKVVTLPVELEAEKEYRLSVPAGAFVNGNAKNAAIFFAIIFIENQAI